MQTTLGLMHQLPALIDLGTTATSNGPVLAGAFDDLKSLLASVKDLSGPVFGVIAVVIILVTWVKTNTWVALLACIPIAMLGFVVYNIEDAPAQIEDTVKDARTNHPAGS